METAVGGERMKKRSLHAVSLGGIVAAPHYLAAETGRRVLEDGGNALEAMIAMAAVITVVYPHMNSIGGDNFWLFYDAKKKVVKGINGSGRSGKNASIDWYKERGWTAIPARGYEAANTVPGAVSGWDMAYTYSKESMGGRRTWRELLEPAVQLADGGFPVSDSQAYWTKMNVQEGNDRNLQRFPGFSRTFLRGGRPYEAGERFRQRELADTLAYLQETGAAGFYTGKIARQIAAEMAAGNGLLTEEDFSGHQARWEEPLYVPYRSGMAANLPPNTQGMASLEILNILNQWDLGRIPEGSAAYYQLMIEAAKEAFADRDQYLTDPDFADIPLKELLSPAHGKKQAEAIRRRTKWSDAGLLDPKGDTVWLGAVDEEGNAVSMIQSIYYDFGSGIVAGGTGITLQNRGSFFSLDPGHINRLEPRKRTFHTLNPPMLFKDGKSWLVYGTMGGEGQPQTQAALVTRIIDYGFSPSRAIDASRWLYGRSWGEAVNSVRIEGRAAAEVFQELEGLGYPVQRCEDYTDVMGHAGAIYIDPDTGMRTAGADPRSDGAAEAAAPCRKK